MNNWWKGQLWQTPKWHRKLLRKDNSKDKAVCMSKICSLLIKNCLNLKKKKFFNKSQHLFWSSWSQIVTSSAKRFNKLLNRMKTWKQTIRFENKPSRFWRKNVPNYKLEKEPQRIPSSQTPFLKLWKPLKFMLKSCKAESRNSYWELVNWRKRLAKWRRSTTKSWTRLTHWSWKSIWWKNSWKKARVLNILPAKLKKWNISAWCSRI